MIKTIKADSIEWPFYVRHSLNEDHVLYLTELYEQGQPLPPITVCKDGNKYIGLDGRHRYYAQVNLLERESIKCDVIAHKADEEMIFSAFQANLGGPLPPTKDDIKHTIKLMLSKTSREKVYQHFCPKYYDRATIKRYMDDIKSLEYHQAIRDAKRSVLENNSTIVNAATIFKVDEQDLRNALGGKKKGYKVNIVAQEQSSLTYVHKSTSMKYQAAIRRVIAAYEEGNIPIDDIYQLIDGIDIYARNVRNNMEHWRKRIDKLVEMEKKNEKS